ncbi:MAG TPA: hypothetical protein VEI07_24525 [Planctomycetaceae bacterium]|nr:hypothetical protein [Planctomycetaceae bacterium]
MAVHQIGTLRYSTTEDRDLALRELFGYTTAFSMNNRAGITTKDVLLKAWGHQPGGAGLVFLGWMPPGDPLPPGDSAVVDLSPLQWQVAKFEIWWRRLDGGDPMWVIYTSSVVPGYYPAIHIVWDSSDVAHVYAMPHP